MPMEACGPTSRRPRWELCAWSSTRWVDRGLAIAANGELGEALKPMRKATVGVLRRLIKTFSGDEVNGVVVPVVATVGRMSLPDDRQRATVQALCAVLAREPSRRARLDDEERCRRLVADVTASWIGVPAPLRGMGRDSTDIHTAMDLLGLTYDYHRPLEPLDPATADDVIDAVKAKVDANPYRAGRPPIERAEVAEIVRRHYLDIAPWPFQALA